MDGLLVSESWKWLIWKAAVKRNVPSGHNCEQCICLFTLNGGRDELYLGSCVVTMIESIPWSKTGRLETQGSMWMDLLAWAQVCKSTLLALMPKEKSPLITWQRSTFLDQVLFSAIPVLLQWVPDGHGVSRKCYEEAPKHRILLPKGPATGESSVCLTLSFDAWRDHSTTWWWVDYIRPLSASKEYQFVLTELKPVVNGICFPCPQCLSWACRVSDIPTWGPAQCQCKPRQQLTSCRTSDKLLTLSEPQLPHLKMKNLIIIVLVLMYMKALI